MRWPKSGRMLQPFRQVAKTTFIWGVSVIALFSLAGCSSIAISENQAAPPVSSPTMSPSEVAKEVCMDIHSGNLSGASKLSADSQLFALNTSDKASRQELKTIFGKEHFSIGSTTIAGNKAVVTVKVSAINLGSMYTELTKVMWDQYSGILTNAELHQELKDIKGCPLTTTNEKLNLVKEHDKWLVSKENSAFVTVILGGNTPVSLKWY